MKKNLMFLFSLGGLLFSGYLSYQKFVYDVCALNECPRFLGYPACYYGFAMYVTLFVSSLLYVFANKQTLRVVQIVATMGILFSGYFTVLELPKLFGKGFTAYVMGLPSCAYGLMFYTAILICALTVGRSEK